MKSEATKNKSFCVSDKACKTKFTCSPCLVMLGAVIILALLRAFGLF